MQIFRIGHDVWGRPVLEGVSWNLIWVAVGAGAAVIIAHAIYRTIRPRSA
jgi:hypothetical protein